MRLINLRSPILFAFALCLGIVCAVISIYRTWYFCLIMCGVVLLLLILVFTFCKSVSALRLTCITLLFYIIGAIIIVFYNVNNSKNSFVRPTYVTVSGYVTDGSSFNDSYVTLVLRDCIVYQSGEDERQLGGKVKTTLFLYGSENKTAIGTYVVVEGVISTSYTVTTSDIDTWSYRNNIEYLLSDSELIFVGESKLTLSEKFRIALYSTLQYTMPDTCDIAYALITGDKSMMSETDREAFRQAGIIHILAVSGLHIGFISSALTFVLRKLRCPFWIYAPIVLFAIIMYAYLCGFPPSVMRAVIMTATSLLVYRLHGMVDIPTSLSLAAIGILLVKPLYMFDAGFIMSFTSVFGICCTTQFTKRLLVCRDNIPAFVKRIISAIAVSIGATLGTLPAVAYFYGEVPVLGILINPIIVPLTAICFVWIIFTVAIPYVNLTLVVPNLILKLFGYLCNWVTSLSFATVSITLVILGTILLFIWLYVLGGYVNVHGKARCYTLVCIAVVCACLFVFPASQSAPIESITVVQYYGEGTPVIVDSQGSAYILGTVKSTGMANNIQEYLEEVHAHRVYIICQDSTLLSTDLLVKISETIPIVTVYTFSSSTNDDLMQHFEVLRVYGNIAIKGMIFGTIGASLDIGLYFEANNVKVGTIRDDALQTIGNIYNVVKDFDWILCNQQNAQHLADITNSLNIICPFDIGQSNIYGLNKYGNFTIK